MAPRGKETEGTVCSAIFVCHERRVPPPMTSAHCVFCPGTLLSVSVCLCADPLKPAFRGPRLVLKQVFLTTLKAGYQVSRYGEWFSMTRLPWSVDGRLGVPLCSPHRDICCVR